MCIEIASNRGHKGFTLLELLVTLGVAAVLLAIALPNLRNQILSSQARQTTRAVADALDYARQYALNTSTLTTFTQNGCGYTVTANGPTSTVLTSASGLGSLGVDCSASNLGTVSFMGDGSAVTCTTGSTGASSCVPLSGNRTFSATGGGATWTVTLLRSGLTTSTAP